MQKLSTCIDELREYFKYCPESGVLTRIKASNKRTLIGKPAGSKTPRGYLQVSFKNRLYLVHRVCFALYHGRWPTHEIDHINRIRNDNRISNLREATPTQNAQNKIRPRRSTTPYRGVYPHQGKYGAKITVNGKMLHLGKFKDAMSAAEAYNNAAIEHHGEFAILNKITGKEELNDAT